MITEHCCCRWPWVTSACTRKCNVRAVISTYAARTSPTSRYEIQRSGRRVGPTSHFVVQTTVETVHYHSWDSLTTQRYIIRYIIHSCVLVGNVIIWYYWEHIHVLLLTALASWSVRFLSIIPVSVLHLRLLIDWLFFFSFLCFVYCFSFILHEFMWKNCILCALLTAMDQKPQKS